MTARRLTLSLTTTGRTSGKPRMVTLYGFEDGDRVVIVGSQGGAARHPAWVHNLRADPRAALALGTATRAVRAREVDGDERERLWLLVTAAFPLYATYQRRTARTIPLFALEPVA
jgi:deazaflavin-dependent oxidoreductase (nitroreductase family)